MKRRTLILKMAAVLLGASCCISLRAVNTIIHNATYDFSNLTIGTDTLGGVTYATISYGDLFNGGVPGAPSLPIDYIRFSVPWNATNFTVSTLLRNNSTDNIHRLVYPCQAPRMMNDTTPVTITLPDSAYYYSNAYYPSQNAWIVDEGFLAGENHIVTVAVMPVSFKHSGTGNLAIDMLKKSQTVKLTLSYQLSDSLPMYPIVRQDSVLRQEGYALTQSMVVNPTSVETYAPVEIKLDSMEFIIPNSGDGLNGGPTPHINPDDPPIYNDSINSHMGGELQIAKFPYLIVTTPELFHSVRRIAALKRQKGYGVKVVTIGDVLNSTEAGQGDVINHELIYADDAGKLRQYLKCCYSAHGTEYVLLAGNEIPYRTVPHTYTEPNLDFELISDLYYSDLNKNWTSEDIEYHPELYVGRILSHSGEQIDNFTDKLLRYELYPGHGDYSYLRKAFHSRGREFTGDGVYPSVINELKDIFPYQTIINDTTRSVSKHPKGSDIINSLNSNRVGFASIFNHSDSTRMRVYGRDIDGTDYFIYANSPIQQGDGLNCLTNKQYPMIFYAPTCATIPFDYAGGMCFGEVFTTGKDYGGPVYIGYTRKICNLGATPIFKLFAQKIKEGYYKLGVADALSKGVFRWDITHNEIISHAYLGDPELEIWTDLPQQYSNISITRNDNEIIISGIDTDSTIVAIYNNDGEVRQITTNSLNTNITFNANPNSTIMLYKHNYIPFIAPLVLQNVSMSHSQYVIATDVVAGNSVDSNRTPGKVTVKNGVEYEIEASGTVTLQDGFSVEKGATFAVYPSSF